MGLRLPKQAHDQECGSHNRDEDSGLGGDRTAYPVTHERMAGGVELNRSKCRTWAIDSRTIGVPPVSGLGSETVTTAGARSDGLWHLHDGTSLGNLACPGAPSSMEPHEENPDSTGGECAEDEDQDSEPYGLHVDGKEQEA